MKFRSYFSVDEAQRLATALWNLAVHVDDDLQPVPFSRDPDDDYLISLMTSSGADVLVTGDRDLLEAPQPGVEIISPRQFVERMQG